ncbi:MAG TPA: MupA/Atu3671 family FMN-dependent luciferase-like monooxygenase, partial [Longimicrobium sp.]
LVLRGGPGGDPTFRQAVRRARECVLGAWAHQDLPFEKVVAALRPERSLSHSALFQVMYQLDDTGAAADGEARRGRGVEVEGVSAKFDLTLSLGAHAGGLDGALQYATDLFDRETAVRMAAHLLRVLEQGAAHPDRRCSGLDLLGAEERRRVVEAWNETGAEYAAERRIHALIAESAARTPDAVALVYGGESLTHGELDARANRLAHHLVALGALPEARVGVCLERSAGMVVAMLAVLKAGAAYLPLDPAYPAERLAYMLRDSGASLLVTHSALRGLLDADGVRVVAVDRDAAAIAAHPADAPRTAVEAGNAAYVIYTSGSTGRPKGVVVTHGNAASFFAGMDGRVGGRVPGTWLALTRISFDIHVLELLWTLARGFKVVVQPELAGAGAPARRVRRSTRPMHFSLFYFSSAGEAGGEGRYRLLLEGARFADRNGFHAVWTPERHFHAFGGAFPNPAVAGAAVAAVTERIGIRAGSVVLPLHDPLRVAEEWSVVDNLSGGRVGISFASGWQPNDFVLAPEKYAGRGEGMFRDVETVRALWRGEPVARTNGVGKEIQVRVLPRPVQPELPVWITAGGSPDTFRRAGQAGAAMLTHLLGQSLEELAEKIRAYRQAYRESGAPGEGHVTLMLHTFVGSDLESVRETVRAPFKRYLASSAELLRPVAEAHGIDMAPASPEDRDAILDHAFERYWQSAALMGTPERCGEMVERLKDAGVDEIGCLIDFIDDTDRVLDALHRLDEVRREANRPPGDEAGGGIAGQIRRHGVTHLQCTPSLASTLVEEAGAEALAGLDRVLLGGEPLAPELAARITAVLPEGLVNLYGPTETTVWSTTHAVRPGEARIPIGLPIANTRVYVLDPAFCPQPAGVPGELFIGGPGVARGYLNRPALTAERFLPDPFGPVPGARIYRTGDRVRWQAVRGDDADARTPGAAEDARPFALEFMGRVDAQVKVRGFRIEPGEVESAMRRHPGVRDCAVVAREDRPGDLRLAAYLTAEGEAPEAEALRAHLRGLLPEYMVPASFTPLPALPRLPNGKLDRRALPAPAYRAAPGREPPATVLEARLLEIWEELLGAPGSGVTRSFFDLGGDSFLALRLVGQVARRLGAELPVATLFQGATVREMARAIQAREGGAPALPAGVVPLQPRGSRTPLFCVHPAGRRVLRYLGLARAVGDEQPVFGLEDIGEDLARPLARIAADHVRAVRAVQPRGPYALAGWSFGGFVAWEMAVQLERAGERVSFLGVLDSLSPVLAQRWPEMPDAQLAVSLAGDAAAGMRRPFAMEWRPLQGLPFDEIVRRVAAEARAQDAVPAEFDETMLRRHCAEIRDRRAALAGYVPGSFSGTLTLFRATEDRAAMEHFLAGRTEREQETLGWCRHVRSVRVLPVPGS